MYKVLTQSEVAKAVVVSEESNMPLPDVMSAMMGGAQFMTAAELKRRIANLNGHSFEFRYTVENADHVRRGYERLLHHAVSIELPWYTRLGHRISRVLGN